MSTVSERSWNSSDDYEDNNSINRSSVSRRISLDLDLPGGVITTHCVSTVIRPGNKQTHDPLQFVKIQSTELSKKAVEQIRLAEEVKITKEKIKEVEEEWQNNLLNWKSKRRQSRLTGGEESDSAENQQRKVKTFSEILNEKAKSGHRIGYNLHKYIGIQDEEEEEQSLVLANNNTNNNNHKQGTGSSKVSNGNNNFGDYHDQDDESSQLKSYEHQQAELQKKRQELNHKLQELEQLEKKQNELERQERVSSAEVILSPSTTCSSASMAAITKTTTSPDTLTSPPSNVIVSIKNDESSINPPCSGNGIVSCNISDEMKQKGANDNFREKRVNHRNSSSRREQQSSEESQTAKTNDTNRQKSVWNYLLQQQDDPRVVNHSHLSNQNVDPNQHYPSNKSNSQFNQIDSESEDDDHLNDSIDADEDAEKEQMLSFRAKLSTFESLSKCNSQPPPPTQQTPPPPQQQQHQQNNHNNKHYQQQHQQSMTSKPIRKSEKVKKTADQLTSRFFPSAAAASSLSLSSSSSSSSSVTIANHNNNNNHSPASSLSSSSTAIPVTVGIPSTTVITSNSNLKEFENSVVTKNNNRPPTAEDLAYKEEMKVFQQRLLQNNNLVDQQKQHLMYASQLPLQQVNSFNLLQQKQQPQQQQHLPHATLHHHHSHPQLHTFQQPLQSTTQPLPRQLLQQSATQLQHHFQQQQLLPQQPSHQKQSSLVMLSSSQPTTQQQSSPYNINHWVIQEAELRRLHYTQHQQQQPPPPPPQSQQQTSPYNINHWVVQEAELRRLHHAQQQSTGPALMARSAPVNRFSQSSQLNLNTNNNNTYENHVYENSPFHGSHASGINRIQNVPGADSTTVMKKSNGLQGIQQAAPSMQPLGQVSLAQQQLTLATQQSHQLQSQGPLQSHQLLQSQQQQQQILQVQQQKQMLSVSGKKKCSNCGDELGRGCAAMVIETLSLYYHINCFRCSVCHIQLGNGTCGTDVRVRSHKLHCHNCYSNDEAGLKFSRV